MKRIKTFLLSVCMMMTVTSVLHAQENVEVMETENSVWTANFDTGVLEITGSGELTGRGINRTFMQNLTSQDLKKLVIGEGFTSVANALFSSYPFRFTEILLPSTMVEIGTNAFSGCDSIRSLVLPEGVSIVNSSAFDCDSLTSITIPSTVTSIREFAFGRSISSVYISDLVAWCNIEFSISSYGNPMNNWVWFEEGVTTFSETCDLYLNGEKIVDLVIPVPVVKPSAFYGCSAETVTFAPDCCNNDSLQIIIDMRAFSGMTNLKKVVIPDNAVVVSCAFEGCISLEELVIGDNVVFNEYRWGRDELVYTFAGCDNLKRLVIGEGIEVLEDLFGHKHSPKSSYYDIEKSPMMLESIVIPSSLKEIKPNIAFVYQSRDENGDRVEKRTKMYFKDGLSWWKSCYGNRGYDCFVDGEKWKNPVGDVVVPEGVETLYSGKLNTAGITSVSLPQSLKIIGAGAFINAVDLEKVKYGNNVECIGYQSFSGCSSLAQPSIPESVVEVWSGTFDGTAWYNSQPDGALYLDNWLLGCKGEFSDVTLNVKNGTKSIAGDAFVGNNVLKDVIIPESLERIGDFAFSGCGTLRYFGPEQHKSGNLIDLTSGVKNVGPLAFDGCNTIEEIHLGSDLEKIGDRAISSSSARKFVSYAKTPVMLNGSIPWNSIVCDSAVLYVPVGAVEAYEETDGWSDFVYIVETGNPVVTRDYNDTITWSLDVETGKFTLSGSGDVDVVNYLPWDYCSWRITDVEIGENVNILTRSVFEKTRWYSEQPDGLLYADGWLLGFKGYVPDTISVIDVKKGVRGIAGSAFKHNEYITEVNIPEKIKHIGNSAFIGCVLLERVNMNGIEEIAEFAFKNCNSLKTLSLDGVRAIAASAFDGCTSLAALELPGSVRTIGESAFNKCTSLTSIELPHSVDSIGENAFKGCINVREITVGDGIEVISTHAFSGIDTLKTITLGRNVKTINPRAFYSRQIREMVIYSNAKTPPVLAFENRSDNVFFASTIRTEMTARAQITVYVPVGCKAAYEAAWTGFKEIIEIETLGVDEVADKTETVESIYNLRGDKLQQITAPGIYIVNGKKVLVK